MNMTPDKNLEALLEALEQNDIHDVKHYAECLNKQFDEMKTAGAIWAGQKDLEPEIQELLNQNFMELI